MEMPCYPCIWPGISEAGRLASLVVRFLVGASRRTQQRFACAQRRWCCRWPVQAHVSSLQSISLSVTVAIAVSAFLDHEGGAYRCSEVVAVTDGTGADVRWAKQPGRKWSANVSKRILVWTHLWGNYRGNHDCGGVCVVSLAREELSDVCFEITNAASRDEPRRRVPIMPTSMP